MKMYFNFVASNHFNLTVLQNLETFGNNFPDFQTVQLTDENELKLLLEIMNINEFDSQELKNLDFTDFTKYWDISNFKFPELDNQQFDSFYKSWIKKSGRDNNMDEYGNLIFLQGLSIKWNKLKFRLIIKEAD